MWVLWIKAWSGCPAVWAWIQASRLKGKELARNSICLSVMLSFWAGPAVVMAFVQQLWCLWAGQELQAICISHGWERRVLQPNVCQMWSSKHVKPGQGNLSPWHLLITMTTLTAVTTCIYSQASFTQDDKPVFFLLFFNLYLTSPLPALSGKPSLFSLCLSFFFYPHCMCSVTFIWEMYWMWS